MRKVTFSPRARKEIIAASAWWEENREKAPEAFDEDLSAALHDIAQMPTLGSRVESKRPGLRRLFLKRIRYNLYYRLSSDDGIEVVSIWHASRRPPHL